MKKNYDFSKGRRGALVPIPPGKTRITIRLDNEVLEWFRSQVEARGGGSYQTMINRVLRDFIERGHENLEDLIKRALRETLMLNGIVLEATTFQKATALNDNIRVDIPSFGPASSEFALSGLNECSLRQH